MNSQPFLSDSSSYNKTTEAYVDSYNQEQKLFQQGVINFVTTEQLYNAVFENAFHAMCVGNDNGDFIKFNKKLEELFGYTQKEMFQIKTRDLFLINEKSFVDFLNERNEKGIAKAEITGIKKSSEHFPCRISSVNYLSDKGENRFMNTIVNISQDLSARWNIAE
ncbi:MAG TPA: PAS domain S-box protein [Hanamia sp.]